MKVDLLSISRSDVEAIVRGEGWQPYRCAQIIRWLCRGVPYGEMSDLPLAVRARLEELCAPLPAVERRLVSEKDGTVKYLLRLSDGECVESVVMRYKYGLTICVSSQVGCRMGCHFCASTIGGLVRPLTAGELLGQVAVASHNMGERISGIVIMGIGEPLDNYDNVLTFLRRASDAEYLGIGARHISLSTCGVVPGIDRLAEEDLQITLSVSLHAATDEKRNSIMPVNKKYPIDVLMNACGRYFQKTGRRISFEYTLIDGFNDTPADAEALASLLKKYLPGEPAHVNLIPVNPVRENGFKRSGRVAAFRDELLRRRINATVRRTLGSDIEGSCGQLRRKSTAAG